VTNLPTSPQERRLAKAAAKMAKARTRMDLQAMSRRADRLRWRLVRPPEESQLRRPLRLWLPLTPLFILLAPLMLLIMGIAVFLPRPLGVNPAQMVLGVGRMLMALNGTEVEVESPHASVLIKIF
jgi:hypothetical protein